jgi:hypothetical protein
MKSLSPAPTKAAARSQDVRRNVYCTHYGTCLDYAIRKYWEGFTCDECDGYEREQMSPEDAHEEFIRCAALVYLIVFSNPESSSCDSGCRAARKFRTIGPRLAASAESPRSPAYA